MAVALLDTKITALYPRLSKEDIRDDESISIEHQREMLQKYADEQGFLNCKFYVDDGERGTTFDRPGFEKLIEDVEAGLIKRVIVKDCSRFGRNASEVGYYVDIVFPKYDVEFISIAESDKDYFSIHNFINEHYAKDASKKIRAVLKHKGLSGKHLSVLPPYGYKKGIDENGKENWIIDPPAAEVIQKIFDLYVNENYGVNMIADYLLKKKILTPTAYIGKPTNFPYEWSHTTIRQHLMNQSYCGDTVNFKTQIKSYKDKTQIRFDPSNYKIFSDTHQAIIDRVTFEKAREIFSKRKRRHPTRKPNPFKDLLYCADCKSALYPKRLKNENHSDIFICHKYVLTHAKSCSPHSISEKYLQSELLLKLQKLIRLKNENPKNFKEDTQREVLKNIKANQIEIDKKLSETEEKIIDRRTRLEELYFEVKNDLIPHKLFVELGEKICFDIELFKNERLEFIKQKSCLKKERENLKKFFKALENIDSINLFNLTNRFLSSIIERIEIYERPIKGSNIQPEFRIYFIGAGYIDFISGVNFEK